MDATYAIGSEVACSDGTCGTLTRIIVDPVRRTLTHLVVEPAEGPHAARLVPLAHVAPDAAADALVLDCDRAGFAAFEEAQTEEYLPAEDDQPGYSRESTLWLPYYPLGGVAGAATPEPGGPVGLGIAEPRSVTRDRVPVGEVQIRRGQRVHATDGDIGKVRGLVVDPHGEQVTHVLLDEGHLWGKKTVAIPIGNVDSVRGGISLDLAKNDVRDLPEVELAAAARG